jgi:hypothetical protein
MHSVYSNAHRQRHMMPRISRPYSMRARIYLLCCSFAFLAGLELAHSQSSTSAKAPSVDPASLPAHDAHQGLLIAVDPFTSADRYKDKFGKHSPYDAGLIAMDVFFRNDNDIPVRVNLKTMELLVAVPGDSRQHINPLSPEEVADRVLAKRPKDPTPRFPVPRVGAPPSPHNKDWQEFVENLRSAGVNTDLLPPHATTHGFVYFDIDGHYDWIANARFEVPDLAFMNNPGPLFFFEIDLGPAWH